MQNKARKTLLLLSVAFRGLSLLRYFQWLLNFLEISGYSVLAGGLYYMVNLADLAKLLNDK